MRFYDILWVILTIFFALGNNSFWYIYLDILQLVYELTGNASLFPDTFCIIAENITRFGKIRPGLNSLLNTMLKKLKTQLF